MSKTPIMIAVRRGDIIQDVPCGTIEAVEPFHTLCDTGYKTEYRYRAVSSYRDDAFVFWTSSAAIYWLRLIAETIEQRNSRTAIVS